MTDDKVENLVNDLSHLLDEIGMYVVKSSPYVSLRKKPSNGVPLLESMIRGEAVLAVDIECFIGEKAWDLAENSFVSPKIEMLLMKDLDFFAFLMDLMENKENETEYSES
jgi:hypothetical protein